MRKPFQIAKALMYLSAELLWFVAISLPLALTLLVIVEIISLIKSIVIKCQKTITR